MSFFLRVKKVFFWGETPKDCPHLTGAVPSVTS